MTARRRRTMQPGENIPPAAVVIANPATGETSEQVWKRWSQDRAERERQEELRAKAVAQEQTEAAIFAVETARLIGEKYLAGAAPDWRLMKPLCSREFQNIVRQMPEMRQRDVKSREQIITALFGALPAHMHGALTELRTVIELVSVAREAAAFLVGFETGRASGRRDAFRDPRVQLLPEPRPMISGASTPVGSPLPGDSGRCPAIVAGHISG